MEQNGTIPAEATATPREPVYLHEPICLNATVKEIEYDEFLNDFIYIFQNGAVVHEEDLLENEAYNKNNQ